MAATDSGAETGYESNDSSMTVESPKSDPENSNQNNGAILGAMGPSEPVQCSPPLIRCEPRFSFGHIAPESIDPPAGLSFHNIHPFGENGYCTYSEESHQNKIRTGMMRRQHAVRWKHVRNLIPRLKDILGERKLRIAANTNNVETVGRLLEAGVDPRAADDRKRTALHFAACKGYTEIVKLLLDKGADPNQKDIIGNTPLHLAACTNHLNVVTLLLKAGTNVHSFDNSGRTPMNLAQSKLKLLQLDNSYDSLQIKAAVNQVIEMMQAYLQRSGQNAEAELMNAFSSRLNLTHTKEEMDSNVRDLLSSLSQLSLRRNET